MTTQQISRAELSEQVAAHIRDIVGKELTELIRTNIAEAVDPLRKQVTNWGEKLVAGAAAHAPQAREAGLSFARCVRATAAAKYNGSGPEGAIQILKQWGDHDLAQEWEGARQKALAAGDATAGGFLVPTTFSQDLINALRAKAVMRKLGVATIPLATGTLSLPKITAGANASYIGERTSAAKSEQSTGHVTLSFKKLAVFTPISNSLLRYSSPGADMIVRNDLVAAAQVKEDAAFIRGDGMDGSPKGAYYWAPAAQRVACNTSVSLQNTASDLGKLMQKLMESNIPMGKPCWIMAPRTVNFLATLVTSAGSFIYKDELARGTLWSYPVAFTTGVPTNLNYTGNGTNDESEIYFIDIEQALIGEALSLVVTASTEAAYPDGTTIIPAFTRDETVVLAIAEHDFVMRYDEAVAILVGVDWAPGSV